MLQLNVAVSTVAQLIFITLVALTQFYYVYTYMYLCIYICNTIIAACLLWS